MDDSFGLPRKPPPGSASPGSGARLRIVHVVPTYFPAVRYGGPIVSIRATCAELARQGHQVRVLTTNVDGPGVLDVPPGVPQDVDGAEVCYYPAPIAGSVYFSPALARGLAGLVADTDIVHIHSVFTWTTPAAAFYAARAGVPYLVSPRGALVTRYIKNKSRIPKTLWLQALGRPVFARAARLHVTTQAEYAQAQQVGLRLPPPLVVPNGIDGPDPDTLPPLDAPLAARVGGQPYLLFLGRIDRVKRLELILEAIAGTGMRLLVAGDGSPAYRADLERLVDRLGLAQSVVFVGHVSSDQKWNLLHGARALVLASEHENYGNVVVEAMAAGRPVVVTPGVGAAEHVRAAGAGAVVEPTPAALREALLTHWHDPARGDREGEAGRRLARDALTAEATTGTLLTGYRRILASSPT